MTAGMEEVFKSLTDRGASGYKKFSASFCNSQTLAAELFQQNEWQRSIPLGRTPSNKSEQLSVHRIVAECYRKVGGPELRGGRQNVGAVPQARFCWSLDLHNTI
jgi:hypothetical protein